ncbi:MAG: phosphoribosylamine--glycine ligase [bacterium]|nr:phosphoribosylamine--glycine ligase [bacterium]
MDILIIGSGGREHALAWKLAQSPKIKNIFITPGNAGTASLGQNLGISKTSGILKWLDKNKIGLVLVGPDSYLAEGIVDKLQKRKIPAFGPTKAAAKIEWSKSFAKKFMQEEGIPTAYFEIFKDVTKAFKYIQTQQFPVVIKADGLALGKGVVIVKNLKEARQVLKDMIGGEVYGKAGKKIVIEEYLQGKEISVHAFCDGKNAILFPVSKDHKSIFDGNKGPNTGGMGTIAPVPGVTNKQIKEIENRIILPTVAALRKRGFPFSGILFPGVMITKEGPKVIEFNARFGDPETQAYMRILKTDLAEILLACVGGQLKSTDIKWGNQSSCCVVCSSGGYPSKYTKGKTITGLNHISNRNVVIFHAGTKSINNKIITNGGRVIGITATGKSLGQAVSTAYKAMGKIFFDGMHFRKDIGE